MPFIGGTCQNMYAIGYADVQTLDICVSNWVHVLIISFKKLMISVMVPCRFVSMNIRFTPWELIMWANLQSQRMETSGFLQQFVSTQTLSELYLLLINVLPQPPVPCITMYSWNLDSLLYFEVTKVVNGQMQCSKN